MNDAQAANDVQAAEEVQRMHASCDELAKQITAIVGEDGVVETLDGLRLIRCSSPTELGHSISRVAFCVIAQGSKEIMLGDKRYRYDPAHYLIVTAALPIAARIIEASPEKPYLGMTLNLDPAIIGSVMVEAGHPAPRSQAALSAVDVSPLDAGLLDAVVRLVRLVASPTEARFLAPLVTREIFYRLLMGEQSSRLRTIPVLGGRSNRIAEAIARLRNEFDQPLRIEEMARDLGMSVSGFHHNFKAVTAMSPLQFQKQLRLQEARRLLLGEHLDAASAGSRVGYDDASHFNREYKSLFGAPPMRDVERLQKASRGNADL